MLRLVRFIAALIGLAVAGIAAATSPTWELDEIFTNADGSVQFVVYSTIQSGQQFLSGYTLDSTAPARSWRSRSEPAFTPRTFTFPNNLPGDSAHRSFLVATQGFADLRVVEPDYVVPNGFFPVQGGHLAFAGQGNDYGILPTNGVDSVWLDPNGVASIDVAIATNFAGQQYAFQSLSPVWGLNEVYSNADGSVQFVVHSTTEHGQQHLGGLTLVASGGGIAHSFTFPGDLPGDSAGHSYLIATQGFADLNVLQPDYVVPNAFFPLSGGGISVAGHGYQYLQVPTDGTQAFWLSPDFLAWYDTAVATNFAGGQYTFAAPPPPPPCRRWPCQR